MKILKKIIITMMILFSMGSVSVEAINLDDLNFAIKDAQNRLNASIFVLNSINEEMCDIILKNPWSDKYNAANQYFLNFYRKEFNEYSKAVGDLESLNELRFYASMNDLSNKSKS